ncbi:hypothetical protein COR50_05465 [Chitinophaga caeni]|uniref:ABC transporter permease n=1 Tax=Chitinophaga caeni TaxID=2029983 RepID=A0A291QS56_9BACT|nr:hypothetical protein [Chitinophaga caeni]ATL46674.1 hypothetical protein COR50_05465 [Chitinophaga caeni]
MHTFNQLLKKIIRSGIGKSRYWMAYLGLGIAMILIFISIQLYANFNELLHSPKNKNESADFLVLNKNITRESDRNAEKNAFTPSEIADIEKQSFVADFGIMTASQFKVEAQPPVELQFSTALFFESVPDRFLDIKPEDWKWQPGNRLLPIVLPNSMLNMYNFGFALSQGLPQISQDNVKLLPIKVTIYNNYGQEEFVGKIAGFSDRISSILVPQTFMDWANKKYAPAANPDPNRVIIKTKDPGDPLLTRYLEKHKYATDADKLKNSKIRTVVQIIVSVIGAFGVVLLLFALLVFSMFIRLIISSCRKEINLLVTLGTAPSQLKRYLLKQFVPMYFVIAVVCLALISIIQLWAAHRLEYYQLSVSKYPGVGVFIAALAIVALLYVVNSRTIQKYISK